MVTFKLNQYIHAVHTAVMNCEVVYENEVDVAFF